MRLSRVVDTVYLRHRLLRSVLPLGLGALLLTACPGPVSDDVPETPAAAEEIVEEDVTDSTHEDEEEAPTDTEPNEEEPETDSSPPELQTPAGSWEGTVDSEDMKGEADFSSIHLLSALLQSSADAVLAPAGLTAIGDVVDPFLISHDLEIAGRDGDDLVVVLSQERPDGSSQSVFGRFFTVEPDVYGFFGVSPVDATYFEFTLGDVEFTRPAPGAPPASAYLSGLNGGGAPGVDVTAILDAGAGFYQSFEEDYRTELEEESIGDLGWLYAAVGTLEATPP